MAAALEDVLLAEDALDSLLAEDASCLLDAVDEVSSVTLEEEASLLDELALELAELLEAFFDELVFVVTEMRVGSLPAFFIFSLMAFHKIGIIITKTSTTTRVVVRMVFPRVCLRFCTREKLPSSSRSSSNCLFQGSSDGCWIFWRCLYLLVALAQQCLPILSGFIVAHGTATTSVSS